MGDIVFLHGAELCVLENWFEHMAEITRHEPHLLAQSPEDIRACGEANRVILAVDRSADNLIVGSISLVPLGVETAGIPWLELMMVYVDAHYRFPQTRISLVDELHRKIMDVANGHNLLSTTTNPSEVKSGIRVGLVHIAFANLPPEVWQATCICPLQKIGASNPLACPQRDCYCVARISRNTWEQLGCPPIEPYPNL